MELLSNRMNHRTYFHTVYNSLHMDSLYPVLKFLSQHFTNGRIYEACSSILWNRTTYYCSWAGTIGIELNLLCTAFISIIIVLTTNRISAFSFLIDFTETSSFITMENQLLGPSSERSPMQREITILGDCAFLRSSWCIENNNSLFVKNTFNPCGMGKCNQNIKRCKLSFIKHQNLKSLPTSILDKPSTNKIGNFIFDFFKVKK